MNSTEILKIRIKNKIDIFIQPFIDLMSLKEVENSEHWDYKNLGNPLEYLIKWKNNFQNDILFTIDNQTDKVFRSLEDMEFLVNVFIKFLLQPKIFDISVYEELNGDFGSEYKKTNLKNKYIKIFHKSLIDMKQYFFEIPNINKKFEVTELLERLRPYKVENLEALKKESAKSEWENIVNEMAHSINTDIYVSLSYQSIHEEIPDIRKSIAHTKHIRDLINLIMWYLKKDDLKLSGKLKSKFLKEIIESQLQLIQNGISTLRLNSDEHEDKLSCLEIPIEISGISEITINEEFGESIDLIIKDLLRNALKNTDTAEPKVQININEEVDHINLEITNNSDISDEYADWFNLDKDIEVTMSKSDKVGLRMIKKWITLLKIHAKLLPDHLNHQTKMNLLIPKEIKIEQKI